MKHSTWGSVPLCMDPTGMWAGDMCRGLQRFARPHTPFVLCTDSLWWFCASESKPDPYLKIHSVRWTTYHQHLSYTCTGQLPCVSFKLSILSLFFPPFHHLSARPLLFIPLFVSIPHSETEQPLSWDFQMPREHWAFLSQRFQRNMCASLWLLWKSHSNWLFAVFFYLVLGYNFFFFFPFAKGKL